MRYFGVQQVHFFHIFAFLCQKNEYVVENRYICNFKSINLAYLTF